MQFATAVSFGVAIAALLRRRRDRSTSDFAWSLLLPVFTLVLVASGVVFHAGTYSLGSAILAALLFGGVTAVTWALYPAGIDTFNIPFCAFVSFVVGTQGWHYAWKTTFAAMVISGLLAARTLLTSRAGEAPSVRFDLVLGVLAVGVMFVA